MVNIVEQMKTVSQKAEHIKVTIYQAIHKEYNDLLPSKSQQDLLKSVKPLLNDIRKLEERFEKEIQPKIDAVTTQHKDLLHEYATTKTVKDLLSKLCECHKELTACKSTPPNQYVKAAKHLKTVKDVLDSLLDVECDIKIFKIVRNEYIEQQTKVMKDIKDAWSALIQWNTSTTASWDSMDGHLKTSVKINHSSRGTDLNVVELLMAMDLMHLLNGQMKTFSQKIYTYILKPLIKFQNLHSITETRNAGSHVLKIVKKASSKNTTSKVIQHENLYAKVLAVVQFLKNSLFQDCYKADSDREEPCIKPISLIGSFIWDDLSGMMIADHLSAAVPSSNSQMEKYESTIKETISFEQALVDEDFIPSGTVVLSKYVKDVNFHFANKVCQDILSEARCLMLSDIHNMVEVDCKTDRAAMSLSADSVHGLSKKVKNMLAGIETLEDEYLNVDLFAFPFCRISESVQKLVDFIYQTMLKATESPYPVACQMFYSCRDVFELFVNVVPTYHKETLKLPQMSALHYNNCMYLAHQCITLGHQFRHSLPEQLKSSITTFVDYVSVLRKCGTDCFLEQLRAQQRELICMLEACNSFTECVTDEGAETFKRAFNQIIHHLTRIAKQWDRVLPVNIFKQAVAALFNTVLENILGAVSKMEDISTEEAGQMHVLFASLVERAPEIIQSCSQDVVDSGISEHIRSWSKFKMLIKLLEASLQEIVNLWDSGEGELALCMNEGEVRTLIRALFQNTDRRSQALSKIKHKQDRS